MEPYGATLERHAEGWLYSGKAADRFWSKSAIGRPMGEKVLLLADAEVIFCNQHRHLDFPNNNWLADSLSKNSDLLDEYMVIEALRVPGNKVVISANLEHLGIDFSELSWAARWGSDKHPRSESPEAEIRWFHASSELDVQDLHEWSVEVHSRDRIAEVIIVDDESSVVTYRVSSSEPSGELGRLQSRDITQIRERDFKPLSNGRVMILDTDSWPDERIGIPYPNGRIVDSICADMIYADQEDRVVGSSILSDLLNRGLHPRPGFKYGTRWRCYDKPLGEEHAPWLVVHPLEAPSDWEGACLASRLAAGVGKTWLHPLLENGEWRYLSISRPPADSRWTNPNRR